MTDILVVNLPFKDHVNPTLGLIKALVEKGYNVTYILTREWQDILESLGASFVPYDQFPDHPNSLDTLISSYSAAYRTALRIGKQYDIIIYEMLFYLGSHLGKTLNKPVIRLCAGSLLSPTVIWQMLHARRLAAFLNNQLAEIIFTKLTAMGTGFRGKLLDEFKSTVPVANIVYTTKSFQIEDGALQDENYYYVGPSIYKETSKVHILFPGNEKALIYIYLDGTDKEYLSFYKRCMDALSDMPVQVIMSLEKITNTQKLGKIPDNFCIYDNISGLEVLPKADLIITSSGMDAISQAIYYGVPIISLPKTLEQVVIANRVEELGIGVKIKKHIFPGCLKRAIIEVISDPIYVSNLMDMSQEAKSLGGDKSALLVIEEIINNGSTYFFDNRNC